MSNFSFSHSVFKRLVSQGRQKVSLCGNGLNNHKKETFEKHLGKTIQEGHDGPVTLHWLIHEIPSYQTLQYVGIGLKHKTPNKD